MSYANCWPQLAGAPRASEPSEAGRAGGWLDDHSRLVLRLTGHSRVTGPVVVASFRATPATAYTARPKATPRATGPPTPTTASAANPAQGAWANMKNGLGNLSTANVDQLTAIVKNRLKSIQYRPALIDGFLAQTGLQLRPP